MRSIALEISISTPSPIKRLKCVTVIRKIYVFHDSWAWHKLTTETGMCCNIKTVFWGHHKLLLAKTYLEKSN